MLTKKEERLLQLIPKGRENAIRGFELRHKNNMNERDFYEAVERLRLNGYPIGAVRTRSGGYYLAETLQELESFLKTYTNQAKKTYKVASIMRNNFSDEIN